MNELLAITGGLVVIGYLFYMFVLISHLVMGIIKGTTRW